MAAVGTDKKWSKYPLAASKHSSKLLCRVAEIYHDGLAPKKSPSSFDFLKRQEWLGPQFWIKLKVKPRQEIQTLLALHNQSSTQRLPKFGFEFRLKCKVPLRRNGGDSEEKKWSSAAENVQSRGRVDQDEGEVTSLTPKQLQRSLSLLEADVAFGDRILKPIKHDVQGLERRHVQWHLGDRQERNDRPRMPWQVGGVVAGGQTRPDTFNPPLHIGDLTMLCHSITLAAKAL
ncbi:hypothetical protein AYL99_10143 [Fonsecaea erecta]|uniref:Uncharacterized protein n=1 Tax=Fonsecaea erecta TaxID=1367422 RepID=A0A178Z925_9EURO|nr:hypothetical protein AYL99_10143 [Fonsecaea erecta]OAP55991.1 hypothetical protein AYL99_10143 [Fonsecaea erecta]